MFRFRKKPLMVKAGRWSGYNLADRDRFCREFEFPLFSVGQASGKQGLMVKTRNGVAVAQHGDWIVESSTGFFSVYPGPLFAEIHEELTKPVLNSIEKFLKSEGLNKNSTVKAEKAAYDKTEALLLRFYNQVDLPVNEWKLEARAISFSIFVLDNTAIVDMENGSKRFEYNGDLLTAWQLYEVYLNR